MVSDESWRTTEKKKISILFCKVTYTNISIYHAFNVGQQTSVDWLIILGYDSTSFADLETETFDQYLQSCLTSDWIENIFEHKFFEFCYSSLTGFGLSGVQIFFPKVLIKHVILTQINVRKGGGNHCRSIPIQKNIQFAHCFWAQFKSKQIGKKSVIRINRVWVTLCSKKLYLV